MEKKKRLACQNKKHAGYQEPQKKKTDANCEITQKALYVTKGK